MILFLSYLTINNISMKYFQVFCLFANKTANVYFTFLRLQFFNDKNRSD